MVREAGPTKFEPRIPSIGTLVRWWIEAIDDGAVWYDRDQARWQRESNRLDAKRLGTGLL
jgi:hypothetical protein